MVPRDGRSASRWVITALVLLASERSLAADPIRYVPASPNPSATEALLATAVSAAGAKLAAETCAEVFSDFRDRDGRTARENLEQLGHTGTSYIGLLLFVDGDGRRECATSTTLAFTSPGSRLVFLCTTRFLRSQRVDPGLTSALLIHEELHSLGVAENPPDSKEITARVIARCGR